MGQNIYLITNQHANYNALQVSTTKQMSNHFSISGFYVWSRAMQSSNESAIGQMTAQNFGYLGNPFTATNNTLGAIGGGLQEERGPMDADRRNNAVISAMWNIGFLHTGSNMFVKVLANGWTITPVEFTLLAARAGQYGHRLEPLTMTAPARKPPGLRSRHQSLPPSRLQDLRQRQWS